MQDIIKILNSFFKIKKIAIENFTIPDTDISIIIEINSDENKSRTIVFEGVSRINIDSEYYTCSDKSSIIIEDLSSMGMEGITYKVSISEDVMIFYCSKVRLG